MDALFKKLRSSLNNNGYFFRNDTNTSDNLYFRHKPSSRDKKYLIWSGKYKTVEEIPEYVSTEAMQRATTKIRIRVCNIMLGLSIIGCVLMSITGRRAAERGESVAQLNVDWHADYNKKANEKKEN